MKFFSLNKQLPALSIVALLLLNSSSVDAVNNSQGAKVTTCNECASESNYFCRPAGNAYDGVLCCTDNMTSAKSANGWAK